MRIRASHFFAPLWPLLIILTVHSLLSLFIPPRVNPFILYSLVCLSDFCALLLYTDQVQKTPNHRIGLIQGMGIVLLSSWILFKLFSGEFMRGIFSPFSPGSLYTLIFCSTGWLLTLLYTRPLIYWAQMMEILGQIDEKALSSKIRQYSFEVQKLKDVISKVRYFTIAFTLLSLFLLIVFSFITSRIYPFQMMITLISVIFCFAFIFYTRGLDEETQLISEGIKLKGHWTFLKARRFFLTLLFLSIPSLLICQIPSAIPLPIAMDELFTIPQIHYSSQAMGVSLSLPFGESVLTGVTLKVLRYSLEGVVAAFFLLFLLFPFLWEKQEREKKHNFRRFIGNLNLYFTHLKGAIIPPSKQKLSPENGQREPQALLPSAKRVLRAWKRIVRWGDKRGYQLKQGASPSCYIRSLVLHLPHRQEELGEMALFLDNYFYSKQIIEIREIEAFIYKSKTLLREEKKR